MTTDTREKAVAICNGCEAICAVWMTADGEVLPISSTTACECTESALRVLGSEILR